MNVTYQDIRGLTAWIGTDIGKNDWLYKLEDKFIEELDRVRVECHKARKSVNDVTAADFHSKILLDLGKQLQLKLRVGPGFLLLRGWNIKTWSEEDSKILLWGIGTLLGVPRFQNLQNDRISVVADVLSKSSGQKHRGASTVSIGNEEIFFHTEKARPPAPPRLISLLCLSRALKGGESVLISGHTLYNRLLADRPETLNRLHQVFTWGRHAEAYPDGKTTDIAPVFSWHNGRLRVQYNRPWLNVAEQATGVSLDSAGRTAVDFIDDILAENKLALSFLMNPGDLLIVDNYVVLHARRKFMDGSEKGEQRRLLRLWVD